MTSVELRQQATELRDKVAKVVAAAEKDNREVTEDEETQIATYRVEVARLEKRAKTVEAVEAEIVESRKSAGRTAEPIERERDYDDDNFARPGKPEDDRRYSFSHWLTCVDSVSNPRTNLHVTEESRGFLENMYRSKYNEWDTEKRSKEVRKEARNLAMNSGTSGGYLMPEAFYDKLMEVATPMSIVRPRATVIPLAAESIKIPSLDQTTAQAAGSPPYYGGVVLTWTGESVSIPETDPAFRSVTITLNELTGYCPVGRTLLQKSAISLEPLIYRLFGGAAAFAEDYAFLRGNGIGKPFGIITSVAGIKGPRIQTGDRGSSTAISFANATDVWVRVLGESQQRGIWLISKAAEAAVLKMTGTANSVFFPTGVYTPQTDVMNAGPSGVMLYMRPVVVTAKLPGLDVDGDFNFFDFSNYIIADGGPPEVASSDDYLFRTNERAFRIVWRVGGTPWMNNAITLEDATTTNSPFVSLGIH
jgi:HK97 family phage major capsid protein